MWVFGFIQSTIDSICPELLLAETPSWIKSMISFLVSQIGLLWGIFLWKAFIDFFLQEEVTRWILNEIPFWKSCEVLTVSPQQPRSWSWKSFQKPSSPVALRPDPSPESGGKFRDGRNNGQAATAEPMGQSLWRRPWGSIYKEHPQLLL